MKAGSNHHAISIQLQQQQQQQQQYLTLLVLVLFLSTCHPPFVGIVEAFSCRLPNNTRRRSTSSSSSSSFLHSSIPRQDFGSSSSSSTTPPPPQAISTNIIRSNRQPRDNKDHHNSHILNNNNNFEVFSLQNSGSLPARKFLLPGGLTPKALVWSLAIVLALAESLVEDPADFFNGAEIGYNIVDAALPLTPTDLVAVTIGEVTAGAIAPFVSLAVLSLVSLTPTTKRELGQAVADADFLVARAATQPILLGLGLPPGLSKLVGGFLALVPSEVVKEAARSRDEYVREELEKELQEELDKQFTWPNPFQHDVEPKHDTVKVKSPLAIEIFSDLLKWLSYGAMCVKWEAALAPLSHVQECAIYGILANVGSQAYMDLMDKFFLGEDERNIIQSRSFKEWKSIYLSQGICGATLFGLYEGVQEPATRLVSYFLQG